MTPRSVVTVDVGVISRNVDLLCRYVRPAEFWAVVKADAYGHGAQVVARAVLEAGASALCVATAAEADDLRRVLPNARIIVLGPTSEAEHDLVRAARAELVVGAEGHPSGIPLHLKVDTGMGRSGVRAEKFGDVGASGGFVGVMTHLAVADSPEHDDFTGVQLERFEQFVQSMPNAVRHAANSAAVLRFPHAHYDAVRCGIALYGLSPFVDRLVGFELKPALSWHSHIRAIKTLQAGESTGYGRAFVAKETTRIGLVPVGYADGFPRALRNSHVVVGDQRCRVVGWPSMDSFTVALGGGIDEGAEVTIVGDGVAAEEHAATLATINYEFVCGITGDPARCERVVVGG